MSLWWTVSFGGVCVDENPWKARGEKGSLGDNKITMYWKDIRTQT